MHINNPYAQGGWSHSANGKSISSGSSSSVFGALPSLPSVSSLSKFIFTSFNPSILNCIVLGPQSRPCLRVVTNVSTSGHSLFQDLEGNTVASIEWHEHPIIQNGAAVVRQNVSHWLRLSRDQRFRFMESGGKRYMWVPQDNSICMYTAGSRDLLARISRDHNNLILEMSFQAIQLGLLEVCVIATVLLHCGRSID